MKKIVETSWFAPVVVQRARKQRAREKAGKKTDKLKRKEVARGATGGLVALILFGIIRGSR